MTTRLVSALVAAGFGLAGCASETTIDQAITGPVLVTGNPTCADVGMGSYSFKIDPPVAGHYGLDAVLGGTQGVDVVIDPTGTYVDWTATIGIDAVIVKGGAAAYVYSYDPEATSDTGLHSPNNDSGSPAQISHIDFCFDYEVAVTKTADTSFTRTYQWAIDKTATLDALTLAAGETYVMPYAVAVTRTGFTDSDWAISGTVTISNPAPFPADIDAIDDELDGSPVALDCGVITLPYELAPLATMTCTYEVARADATDVTNHVTVVTCGIVGGGEATADACFEDATITEVDACATVTDDHAGTLGVACGDQTFEYTLEIGPYATCDTTETFVNTAQLATDDTCTTATDSWTVTITVPPCDLGCTLTPGYWKTHSSYGPAPYDDTWANLTAGADTSFFKSGTTWYGALWTQPRGNPYWILAHAYIAAQLNVENGASATSVASTLDAATTLFQTYTPGQIASIRRLSPLAAQFISLASTLDDYNNGLVGPGHCSE